MLPRIAITGAQTSLAYAMPAGRPSRRECPSCDGAAAANWRRKSGTGCRLRRVCRGEVAAVKTDHSDHGLKEIDDVAAAVELHARALVIAVGSLGESLEGWWDQRVDGRWLAVEAFTHIPAAWEGSQLKS